MDELDSWMRKYIDRYRLHFLNLLRTELVFEGFPGLHNFIRDRAKTFYRQDGYFTANSFLLDSITKIDDFSEVFIKFCEKHDINAELVRIVRAGLDEYDSKFGNHRTLQSSHNLTRNRSDGHRENSHIPHVPNNVDQGSASQGSPSQGSPPHGSASQGSLSPGSASQGSASQGSASQGGASQDSASQSSNSTHNHSFLDPLNLTDPFQNQSDSVDRENLLTASNNLDQTTNEESVSHESKEETTDDIISRGNAACLVSVIECTISGFKGAGGNAGVNFSDSKFEMQCPCPYHTNVVDNNENNAKREHGHESEPSTSSSDAVNMQRIENELKSSSDSKMQKDEPVLPSRKNNMDKLPSKSTTSNYNPNIDTRKLVQKKSHADKAASMAEHLTQSHVNIGDAKNNPTHEMNSARGHLKNSTRKYNNTDNQFQEGVVSKENTLLGNLPPNSYNPNVSNNGQKEITLDNESWGSYYLSSSDEEDLLPAQNAEDLEIDNLKENPILSSQSEEPVLRFHIPELTEVNFQRFGPLDMAAIEDGNFQGGGPLDTSDVKFIVQSTGLSGIECQEDLDKFKTKPHTEERVENSAFGDESKKYGEALSDSKNLSKDVKCHLKAINHRISDNCNTIAKTVDDEDTKDKQKPVSHDCFVIEHNESLTPLTDFISSETDLKEGNDKNSILSETNVKEVNEITEAAPQQQACEESHIKYDSNDFHLLHLTASISNVQELEKVTKSLVGSKCLPLAVTSILNSGYAGSSEGFETHTSDDLDISDSDLSSVNRLSDDVSEGSQPFIREVHISEPSNTQTVSIPLDALSINTSTLITPTHSVGQQQSNTLCQTVKDDNSICPEFCQNDGSDYNINFSELNSHSSENNSQEINNSTSSNIRISNITGLLTFVKRIIDIYFPELSIRL